MKAGMITLKINPECKFLMIKSRVFLKSEENRQGAKGVGVKGPTSPGVDGNPLLFEDGNDSIVDHGQTACCGFVFHSGSVFLKGLIAAIVE